MNIVNDNKIAVLIPCLNEEKTIATVVEGFIHSLPDCSVYVYDNGSSDKTVEHATRSGAIVNKEVSPGKGNVVRRMFADIDADLYVLVDGDSTYDPQEAPLLIKELFVEKADMVVGCRVPEQANSLTFSHRVGNNLFNRLYTWLFGRGFNDIFSGYRVFTKRFVKTFPSTSKGFEIETEISVHSSQLRLPVREVNVSYSERPEGSISKLRTFFDGMGILRSMLTLMKDNRPFALFGFFSAVFMILSLLLGLPVLFDFIDTGLVARLPTAILSTGLAVFSVVSLSIGLALESISRLRLEAKLLAYLKYHE